MARCQSKDAGAATPPKNEPRYKSALRIIRAMRTLDPNLTVEEARAIMTQKDDITERET